MDKKVSHGAGYFNVLGIVVLVLVVLIVSLSFAVQNYTYNGILQALNANSRELTNVFIDYKNKTSSDFTSFCIYLCRKLYQQRKYGADGY